MLGATETLFLNEGFPSALPASMGKPTAVNFIPQQDTSTGVGECLVFGERGVESFFLSIPRDQWKDSAFQRTALLGIGNASHRSTAIVNSDIWFRAQDGWRSYRQARAQVNQYAQIPMSSNVRQYVVADDPGFLDHCSAISFDNRLVMTSTPYPNQGKPYHNGGLLLDFDILSTFGQATFPSWDGHWNNTNGKPLIGAKILQLVEGTFDGQHRAFAFVLDDNGMNALVEFGATGQIRDTAGPITSRIRGRSMNFAPKATEFNEKWLHGGDIWLTETKEHVDGIARYRPDQLPYMVDWTTFTADPISGLSQGGAPILADGFSPRRGLAKPANDGDAANTKRILRRGYEIQPEIEWTGKTTIRKLRLTAQQETEQGTAKIP